MIRHSSLAFSIALGLLLFWAPLPWGSVESGFRVLLWGLVLLVAIVGLWTKNSRASWQAVRGVVFCMLAIAGLGFLQSLSWPASVARWMSPGHYQMAQVVEAVRSEQGVSGNQTGEAKGALGENPSAEASERPSRVPMSFSSQSSVRAALSWTVVALSLLAASLLGSRKERRIVLGALVCAAVFQTIYGGPRVLGGADLIWGQPMPSAEGRLRGTFVNPNHAAFYIGMVLPVVTAWTWLTAVRFKDGDNGRLGAVAIGLPVVVWTLLAGGLVLTQSRAGALILLVTLGVQLLLLFKRRTKLSVVLSAVALPIIIWLLLESTSGGLRERLWESSIAGSPSGARATVYNAVLSLWREFPLFGSGLGSFRELFSALGPAELRGQWWNAHSDWLELLVTGGVLSVALVLVALVLVLRRLRHSASSISRERKATTIAVLGSLVVMVLHSMVDFGLAMPANAITAAMLVGIGLAPSSTAAAVPRPGSLSRDVDDSP